MYVVFNNNWTFLWIPVYDVCDSFKATCTCLPITYGVSHLYGIHSSVYNAVNTWGDIRESTVQLNEENTRNDHV